MPQAKPTQVIVHRIELQSSERTILKDYVEFQQSKAQIELALKAVQPTVVALGVVGATYVGVRGYQALVAALNSIDPAAALAELMEPVPIIGTNGPIFGEGGFFSFFDDFFTSAEDNPLYDPLVDPVTGEPITQESLDEGRNKLRKERGFLNSIVAPFGIAPFPKWL
tara:strand:- start:952 stop:1452 length:501 start_codon:yes stop_codon:yes gene_type:complete